jgi:hypothetical protein
VLGVLWLIGTVASVAWWSRRLSRREVLVCPSCQRQTPADLESGMEHWHDCPRRFERIESWPKIPYQPGPQIAGMRCAVCGEKISFATQGAPCPTCHEPTHLECLPHNHGDGGGPYRG